MTSPMNPSPPKPARARTVLIALGIVCGLGVIALIVWGVRTRQARDDAAVGAGAPASAAMADMPGMAGMAGMDTPTDGSISLTATQLRQFGITFGTADVRPLVNEVRAPGVVVIDERKITQVSSKFGGYIERLYVNATGQPVRSGEPLLEVYSPELLAAQQELLVARQLQNSIGTSAIPGVSGRSMNLVDAARERLRLWDISDAQIDSIVRSGEARRTLTLFAPTSGIVMEKAVVNGQAIMPGTMLFTIANLSTVWIETEVREVDAANIRVGSPATIELSSFPGRPLIGRVEYVYPVLEANTRTIKARITVPNADGRLKPGMYAVAHLTTPQGAALTVPTSALLRTGQRNVVFVDIGNGKLRPQEVELGRVVGEYSEVLAGVEPGQRVVTSAQFLLDSESNLGEVMKAMMSQMGTGGQR